MQNSIGLMTTTLHGPTSTSISARGRSDEVLWLGSVLTMTRGREKKTACIHLTADTLAHSISAWLRYEQFERDNGPVVGWAVASEWDVR